MPKFCGKCGNEVMDGSAFCPECGEKFNGVTYNTENYIPELNKPTKNLKKRIICIVVAVAVVFGAVGIFRAIFSDSAEDVAIKYIEACATYDWKEASQYLAIDFDKYIETAADAIMDYKNESADEYFRSWQEDLEDDLEDVEINEPWDIIEAQNEARKERLYSALNKDFGDSLKIEVEIKDKEEIEESEIKWYIKDMSKDDNLKEFDINLADFFESNKVGKAYKMTLEITGDTYEPYEYEIYVVKYDGDWKVLELPSVTSDVDLY